MTRESWTAFRTEVLSRRDVIMAEQIADRLESLRAGGDPRPKALVIMNFRHAFPNLELRSGGRVRRMENTAGILMERFPGRVRNVLLNTIAVGMGARPDEIRISAIRDGMWDAAFEVAGNPGVGFHFAGSPFGADTFDLFPVGAAHLTYADAFTGFVFHEPLTRHRLVTGVPEVIDSAFASELVRRFLVTGVFQTERAARDSIDVLRVRRETGYEALPQDIPLRAEIQRWRVRKQDGGGSWD
jgi:hypothetical protein